MSIKDVHEYCLQDDPEGTYLFLDHVGFAGEIKELMTTQDHATPDGIV